MPLDWLAQPAKNVDHWVRNATLEKQSALTYPPQSLNVLQEITADFAGWQGSEFPALDGLQLIHIVDPTSKPSIQSEQRFYSQDEKSCDQTKESENLVSIVRQMPGLNSVTQLNLAIHNTDTTRDQEPSDSKHDYTRIISALAKGRSCFKKSNRNLLIGVAATPASTDAARHIYQNLSSKVPKLTSSPLSLLLKLNGIEFAALIGAYIGAAQAGVPILVNGFVATAAALLAVRINPTIREWMLFTSKGRDEVQERAYRELQARPMIQQDSDYCEHRTAAQALEVIHSSLGLNRRLLG